MLIANGEAQNSFDSRFTLASRFNIRITEGKEYASDNVIAFVLEMMQENAEKCIRRNVKDNICDVENIRQISRYTEENTVSDAVSSLIDEIHESALDKDREVLDFVIISEDEAKERLRGVVEELLSDYGQYNKFRYSVLKEYVTEFGNGIDCYVDKDTVIKLLIETRNVAFAKFLKVSDVVDFVYRFNSSIHTDRRMKNHLDFTNRERKFISEVIRCTLEDTDKLFSAFSECNSKQRKWQIILRNIHYKPVGVKDKIFFKYIHMKHRSRLYSRFEEAMREKNYLGAAMLLRVCRGVEELEKHLDYIVSRCESRLDVLVVIRAFKDEDGKDLIRLRMKYQNYNCTKAPRTFIYWNGDDICYHRETREEVARRKSLLTPEQLQMLKEALDSRIQSIFERKYGINKVYISPDMYKIALPIDETPWGDGRYFLPRGSRVKVGKSGKIRVGIEWSGLRNADLNIKVINGEGRELFFANSNRIKNEKHTFAKYSELLSDDGSGYKYYDFDPTAINREYEGAAYVLFSSVIPTAYSYTRIGCYAGCEAVTEGRSKLKSVPYCRENMYRVSVDGNRAILFAFDLNTGEFIWMNEKDIFYSFNTGAIGLIKRYDDNLAIMSLGKMFELMSFKKVQRVSDAHFVISNKNEPEIDPQAVFVRPCDYYILHTNLDKICNHEMS